MNPPQVQQMQHAQGVQHPARIAGIFRPQMRARVRPPKTATHINCQDARERAETAL